MKKKFKLVLALMLAVMMIASMIPAMAASNDSHDITITTHGNETHTYGAYQIFKGNLDAAEKKLSNISWGDQMTSAVINSLQAYIASDSDLSAAKKAAFAAANSAPDFANVLAGMQSEAAELVAFARDLDKALTDNNIAAMDTETTTNKSATLNVPSDGYYFFRDDAAINSESDTYTRFILQVLRDLSIEAKDTVLTPDKEIVAENGTDITPTKDNDASIGDVITYNVTINVPDTTQYKQKFVLNMVDQLEAGLTFKKLNSIKINGTDLPAANYTFTPANTAVDADLVNATGGQEINLIFKNFKQYVEANNLIGKDIVISYDVVLNKNCSYNEDPNENDVHFTYSNNPNHDYSGDEFGPNEPKGTTPHDKTRTWVTKLKLVKIDGADNKPLPGATFRITGTTWNHVLETGEKFVASPYTPAAGSGETVVAGTYYKLKDGTYTTTAPVTGGGNDDTSDMYDSVDNTYVLVKYERVVTKVGPSINREVITDSDGYIVIEGVESGTFTVQEILAPNGYNLDSTLHTLNIDWAAPTATGGQYPNGGFTKGANSDANWNYDGSEGVFKITITNNQGATLPSTGGIGTTIFYVAGSILVLAAAILLITKRRMGNND